MFGRTAGLIALSAITAQAFLLPPNVASTYNNALDPVTAQSGSGVITIPCSDCVFPAKKEGATESQDGDDLFWIQGQANSLLYNFSISEDKHALELNGAVIYPWSKGKMPLQTVDQVASSASLDDLKSNDASISRTALRVTESRYLKKEREIANTEDKILFMTYHVISLEDQPVHVAPVEISLIEGVDGSLMIFLVQEKPQPRPAHLTPHHPQKDCGSLPAFLCKWRDMVDSKFDNFKNGKPAGGCHGKKGGQGKKLPGHIKGPHFGAMDKDGNKDSLPPMHHGVPPFEVEGHPHPHFTDGDEEDRPHRPHHFHHGHHRHHFGHMLHRFMKGFIMVLIPIMAGITMGIFTSVVGMAVGRLIGFLWIKFRRGGQRGYASVPSSDADETEIAEKGETVIVEETEALPVYEAAPAYEQRAA